MSNAYFPSRVQLHAGIGTPPPTRGGSRIFGGIAIAVQRLPTDSTGNYELTLTNLVVGSRVRVEVLTTGAAAYEGLAASSTVVANLPAYSDGSPLNDLKIKVGKASETPYYRRFETQVSITANGNSSIFVKQERDDE